MQQHPASKSLNYQPNTPPAQKLKSAINLAATMPPSKLRKNLIGLITLAPDLQDLILQKIDQPLQVEDSDQHHLFLKTQFNRDGDSYRSPHNNQYYPPLQEGLHPSPELRKLEELGNLLFAEYTKLYYGNSAIGSFFVTQGNSPHKFICGFFAKKALDQGDGFLGSWDSFNIVEVEFEGAEATYNLSTTILIEMAIQNAAQGQIDLTGFLKQKVQPVLYQKRQKRKVGKDRLEQSIVAVGEMVEELQTVMRQHLEAVYISKTKDIVFSTRLEYTVAYEKQRRELAEGLRKIHINN